MKKVNFLVMNAFNVSPGGGDAVQGHAPFFPGGPESPQDIPPLAAPRLRAQQGEEWQHKAAAGQCDERCGQAIFIQTSGSYL